MLQRSQKGLPEDWRERIADKKVIFCNTSIGTLLVSKEKHFQKINLVFDEFKKSSDVVVWWRPHPLELTTIKSKLPDLLEEYIRTRKRFLEEKIGILDESPDLHRAIAVSDAYYGDWSSLIPMYQATGKPILIKSNFMIDNIDNEIRTMDLLLYENKIWFTAWNFNCLLNIDIQTKNIELIGSVPDKYNTSYSMSNIIVAFEKWLIIVPASENSIIRYDMKERIFETCVSDIKGSFFGCVKKSNFCYMIATRTGEILKYNIISNSVEKRIIVESDSKRVECKKNTLLVGDYFYFILEDSNEIGKYDIQTDTIAYIQIGNQNQKICIIALFNNAFYIITEDGILVANKDTWEIEESIEFPSNFKCGRYPFIDAVTKGHLLYLISYTANMLLILDMQDKNISIVRDKDSGYYCGCLAGQELYVGKSDGGIECIDLLNKEIKKLRLDSEAKKEVVNLIRDGQKNSCSINTFKMIETEMYNIRNFIKEVQHEKIKAPHNDTMEISNNSCGNKIYEICKG